MTGEFVIEPIYAAIECIEGTDWARVYVSDGLKNELKIGIIDRNTGNLILPTDNSRLSIFSDGVAVVQGTDGRYKVIDEQGKVLFEKEAGFCDDLYVFKEGIARFLIRVEGQSSWESRYGFIDKTGKVIIEPKLLDAGDFTDGKALVVTAEGQNALVDREGKVLKIYDFAKCSSLSEGLFVYKDRRTGLYGYANLDGKPVTAPDFAEAEPFQDGVAIVKVNDLVRGAILSLTGFNWKL